LLLLTALLLPALFPTNIPAVQARGAGMAASVAALPDLAMSAISLSPASPYTNDDVYVQVDIQNLTATAAASFFIDIYIDSQPAG
jgi:hypothetical protein